MKRVIPFILTVLTLVGLLTGCGGTAVYVPENTLSSEELAELKSNVTTKDIESLVPGVYIDIKYKQKYSDMFENQDLAEHVMNAFKTAFNWYQIIKNNLYEYQDGTVRINFGKTIFYDRNDVPEDHGAVTVFEDAMDQYCHGNSFDDKEDLNAFEKYLLDLSESVAANIWFIGYDSYQRVELEQYIQEAKQKDDKLGITTEALNKNQQTKYESTKYIGSDIQRLEDQLTEFSIYFDIPWIEPENTDAMQPPPYGSSQGDDSKFDECPLIINCFSCSYIPPYSDYFTLVIENITTTPVANLVLAVEAYDKNGYCILHNSGVPTAEVSFSVHISPGDMDKIDDQTFLGFEKDKVHRYKIWIKSVEMNTGETWSNPDGEDSLTIEVNGSAEAQAWSGTHNESVYAGQTRLIQKLNTLGYCYTEETAIVMEAVSKKGYCRYTLQYDDFTVYLLTEDKLGELQRYISISFNTSDAEKIKNIISAVLSVYYEDISIDDANEIALRSINESAFKFKGNCIEVCNWLDNDIMDTKFMLDYFLEGWEWDA